MLTAYIQAAMRHAHYEIIANRKPLYGWIPECQSVWATGETLEACREELQSVLEDWIVLGLRLGLAMTAPPQAPPKQQPRRNKSQAAERRHRTQNPNAADRQRIETPRKKQDARRQQHPDSRPRGLSQGASPHE